MSDSTLRDHLLYLLRGGGAHIDWETALTGMPEQLRGVRPENMPYSCWELLEHMRIAQWDILEFSRNPEHVSPPHPEGYWPDEPAPPEEKAWDESIEAFREDLQAMRDLVSDPEVDLFAPIPHGEGQTILREALLVADHNAYHIGQIVVVRRALEAWI
ncbi:MAG: DinB family protein [Saprospiraceae bacterium]|nr:DinB family protein [Saprospiraceae bacterium]